MSAPGLRIQVVAQLGASVDMGKRGGASAPPLYRLETRLRPSYSISVPQTTSNVQVTLLPDQETTTVLVPAQSASKLLEKLPVLSLMTNPADPS